MSHESMAPQRLSATELGQRRWAFESARYRVVDLDFGFRSDNPDVGAFLSMLLEPFLTDGSATSWYSFVDFGAGRTFRYGVYLGEDRVLSPLDDDLLARSFLWHVNQRVMDETRSFLAIHAGAISVDGKAVLLPGHSEAGKSTLVAALVASGFDYLSDEAALLDPETGRVTPYPRAISLGPGSWPFLPELRPAPHPGHDYRAQWLVPASSVRTDSIGGPCAVRAIVVPCLTPGVDAELRPLSRAAAGRLLAERATNLPLLGQAGFRAIVEVVRSATCWDLALDGVTKAVEAIRAVAA